ncbi:acetate/propionate family kinase [Coleofasciculus chthonoplastes]|uniref:acetate/propionate family kinase n=1 Tax=Coleofasciculus chthonoplastes TaxID=64178 RepID=UPI0032FA73F8
MKVLVLNAGSSTQKSCLYEIGESLPNSPPEPIWEAKLDWTGQSNTELLKVKTSQGRSIEERLPTDDRIKAIAQMLNTLWRGQTQVISQLSDIDVVGHRVVHGGDKYRQPTFINAEVKDAIASLSPLAPSHNPANLEGIEAIENILPDMPQVAVFDTSFHAQIPLPAAIYPGCKDWLDQGIRRYGFHGISHQYCLERVAQLLEKDAKSLRVITCHLGNGCSLAAIRDGISINTTMGYTPLEGLMMGSRSGSIDPSILIQLMRQGYNADQLEHLLNKESGLKGLSGVSSDMRQINDAIAAGNEQAKLALDVYIHRLRFYLGAMLTSLGGLDVLVFAGGVGEHQASVRAAACDALAFLGLKIDSNKNETNPVDADISTEDSSVQVFVIHTQEDWAIAQSCWSMVRESVK